MLNEERFPKLNLQLFGDGAGAGSDTGAEGATQGVTAADALPQTKGEKKNPLSNVKYGIQGDNPTAGETGQVETPDRNAEFEKLIKGEYKDLYDARVQETIQKRFKGTKETIDKYNALAPTLEMLSQKYGVDTSDIEALNKAIQEDDSYYEEEALQKGVSVEQLKNIRKMERENAELKRQMQEQSVKENADRIYAEWMKQSEALKSVYPTFELDVELKNPKFIDLIKNNVDVRTAFEVIHKDEIIGSAMQFAANQTKQKVANNIIANGMRPTENGVSSQSPAVVKSDVSQLSKEDRAEIIRRVQRGDKIRF